MDLLLLPSLWMKREGENDVLLGKGEEASCCGGSAVCLMGGTEAGISGGAVVGNNRVYPLRLPSIETSPHMNELKGRQRLKQESLIHFHIASLHTAFPFGKPQALSTNLRDYLTSAGRSRGLSLFSNLQRWSGY